MKNRKSINDFGKFLGAGIWLMVSLAVVAFALPAQMWAYFSLISVVCVFTGVAVETAIDLMKISIQDQSKKQLKIFAALILILGLGLEIPTSIHDKKEIAILNELAERERLAINSLSEKSTWRSIPNTDRLIEQLKQLPPRQEIDIFVDDVGTESHVLGIDLYNACSSANMLARLWNVSPESTGIFPGDIWVNVLDESDAKVSDAAKRLVNALQSQNLDVAMADWPPFKKKDLDICGIKFEASLLYTNESNVGVGLFAPDTSWHGSRAAPIRIMIGARR